MSLVNRYNFLRWDDGEAAVSIEADLPTGYNIDPSRCDYRPLLVTGEAMRFYINALNGLDIISTPDLNVLNLVNAETGAVVVSDVATLQQHQFIDGTGATVKTYYAEVVIDSTVPVGRYVFEVRSSGNVLLLQSNQIRVVSSNYLTNSCLCKFAHDRYFYGINYQDLAGFYQQFRLNINETDNQFESDKEVYNEITTGKQRTYNNFMKQLKKAETYYFDKYAHEAAAIMFQHDELYINLKRYTAKDVYKISYDQRSKIMKGECELYLEEFASANRCDGADNLSTS
ncbi:MAG: hypothetical protein JNK14_05830 [Chitinophagaceae bacterium]|nr:hypothetical protein [Chitinophagaceae bacterium]